jgi:phosphoribosylformylglycinamidine cyclo-ligase
MDYREAGVDIEEGYRAVERYRGLAGPTLNEAALNKIGAFAGMYTLASFAGMKEPVLVSGTDGVGTKLDIAFRLQKYDTVGIDCVAMCVNDILCHGAQPLFFLDYLACGKLDADVAAALVKGVAAGCRESGCVLLGGETAEMPGFYDPGKYDIAGFAVGIADREKIIDGSRVRPGDALLGLLSSGPHSNGFSLIRRLLPDLGEDFGGMPLGLALLEPTRLYVRPVLALLDQADIHGMAHITGGGFYENVPRMFGGETPLSASIDLRSWEIPPVFLRIAGALAGEKGAISEEALLADGELRQKMFGTFNMGAGLVLALDPADAEAAAAFLDSRGFPARLIGRVGEGPGGVQFVG